jgi:hypothetical protein
MELPHNKNFILFAAVIELHQVNESKAIIERQA